MTKYVTKVNDVTGLATSLGIETKQKRYEMHFKYCPYCRGGDHKDEYTFGVNLETGAFKCLRASCGKHGHFVELARDFQFALVLPEEMPVKYNKPAAVKPAASQYRTAAKYMAARGISEATCTRYGIHSPQGRDDIVVFPFFDAEGRHVMNKFRDANYKLHLAAYEAKETEQKPSKEWFGKNEQPSLYGEYQAEIWSRTHGKNRIVITEGQIDALSVVEATGNFNAVSVPGGCNGFSWFAFSGEWLNSWKEVVIFGDCERGHITLVKDLADRLTTTVKVVRRCDYLGCKDANDLLNFGDNGKANIIKAIEMAEEASVDALIDLSAVEDIDINTLDHISTGYNRLDRTIGGLVCGNLVVLTGKRGEGKSTLMSMLIANAIEQNEHIMVYSGELPNYYVKRWLLYQLAGRACLTEATGEYGERQFQLDAGTARKISLWMQGQVWLFDNSGLSAPGEERKFLLETIEKSIKAKNCRFIFLDNLMTAMADGSGIHDIYTEQSKFVGDLKRMAIKYNVCIVLVAHPRKGQNGEEIDQVDEIAGSADIANKADVILKFARDNARPENSPGGLVFVLKNRLNGNIMTRKENAIILNYEPESRRLTEPCAPEKYYGWDTDVNPIKENSMLED